MTDEPINGDTRIILHRLDQLGNQVSSLEKKQDEYHKTSQARLHECEIQTALLEQANVSICKDIDELQEKSNRNDIIAAISGAITGAGVAIATIWATLKGQ